MNHKKLAILLQLPFLVFSLRVIPVEMAISRYFLTKKLANFDSNFRHVATPCADLKLTMSILRRK